LFNFCDLGWGIHLDYNYLVWWCGHDLAPYSHVMEHDAGCWEAPAHTVLAVLLALEPSASNQVFVGSIYEYSKTVSDHFY
jgi:hypothetical protein